MQKRVHFTSNLFFFFYTSWQKVAYYLRISKKIHSNPHLKSKWYGPKQQEFKQQFTCLSSQGAMGSSGNLWNNMFYLIFYQQNVPLVNLLQETPKQH